MHIIDRRLNPNGKNLPNRQRFIRRARKIIREAVREASASRSIRDVDGAGVVVIPGTGIDEPFFHLGNEGYREPIFPGNKEFVQGDHLARPPGGGGGAGGSKAGQGESEDQFKIALSAEEFLEFFLEDLELPDLERRTLTQVEAEGLRRAGYASTGSPANLAIGRTMRNSLSRRIALKRPRNEEIAKIEAEIAEAEGRGDEAEVIRLRNVIEGLQRRSRAIAYIDPIDIRYRRFEQNPKPMAQAVMFCLMDVSASMTEHMKDLAKRFYMLLFVFLNKRYKKVEIVFIRHTDEAKEVDEQTFFHGTESGGTKVSSVLHEMVKVAKARYSPEQWNIYVAQSSDGDNDPRDNAEATGVLTGEILPMSQYFAYLEVNEPGHGSMASSLWRAYEKLNEPNLSQRSVTTREEIYPVFRELFSRSEDVRRRTV